MKISKAAINNFAFRCFRTTADRDYIHARLAFRSNLFPQFQWSSLHCLEKYVKCILLLNRIKGKKYKHEIKKPIERINREAPFQIEISKGTKKFIQHLESGARYRYLEVSWINYGYQLKELDRAVFEIRKYCQILTQSIKSNGKEVQLLNYNLKRINEIKPPCGKNGGIIGGWLERVLDKDDHPARGALIWKNLWFGSSNRKQVMVDEIFASENSPLWQCPEIIDEVTKYVFLPKEIATDCRERANNKGSIKAS